MLLHGTAIAVIRTNREIAAAADSRVVDERGTILPDVCKIRRYGDRFAAFHGMSEDLERRFSAFDSVAEIMTGSGTLAQGTVSIATALATRLRPVLSANRSLQEFAMSHNGLLVGVIVFGLAQESLTLSALRVFAEPVADGQFAIGHEIRTCPGADCPDGRASVLVPNGPLRWDVDPVTAAQEFVQRQIDAGRCDIGGAIQVLRIQASGEWEWLQRPSACNE
jgi:hypothetical protein